MIRPHINFSSTSSAAIVFLFLAYLLGTPRCSADPAMPALFSDHMVLQQGREICVWGTADPGERIVVTLAGRSADTVANAKGAWDVRLPAVPAGGPFQLLIQGKKELKIRDVMIGEVWIASGQSNMAFALSGAEGAETEIPQANYPDIRFFVVPRRVSSSSIRAVPETHWKPCTPESVKNFSAVAYFFAKDIHRKLGVPVGIIQSAWPGSSIENWIPQGGPPLEAGVQSILDKWNHKAPPDHKFAEEREPFWLELDDFELIPATGNEKKVPLASFDDGSSKLLTGGSFSYLWDDSPQFGFHLAAPGKGGKGFLARVDGKLDGTENSMFVAHYKADNSGMDLSSFSGIRFWMRGNAAFRFRSLQPTVYDWDDYSAVLPRPTSEWQEVSILFKDLKQEGWGVVMPFTLNSLSGFTLEITGAQGQIPAGGLYNGMLAPLMRYSVRGALWYQGESNAPHATEYGRLLTTMIKSWREDSDSPNMNFLIVQLPNHGGTPEQPSESDWATLREAQLMTSKTVPNTGLAVTIDVGDPSDVHPHKKLEVGQRLAMWAFGTIYEKPVVYSGPMFESSKTIGNEVRISFQHVGAGLEARGGELQGFAIAGADRKFHWAKARIDGNTVVVSSPDAPAPVAVRYAWGDSPRCNLFNKDGLPASPFRTDTWPPSSEKY